MYWMTFLGEFCLHQLTWLTGLTVAFLVLVRLSPCNPGMYWWKDLRAAGTDLFYWFAVPLVLRVCRMLMLVGGVALLFGDGEPRGLPVRDLPLWVQCVLIQVLQDVLLYWIHRGFHSRLAWKFHAVHHSPQVLDWTSTARFHPVNDLLAFSLADTVVLLLGFSPAALVLLAPFNIVYSAMVHANLNWTFGPLKYLFASPVFHRWHHTTEREALDKNFAPTFPLLDVLFGTFYMPPGKLPEHFGTGEPDFPESFLGQFLYPFWNQRWHGRAALAGAVLGCAILLGGGFYLAAQRTQPDVLGTLDMGGASRRQAREARQLRDECAGKCLTLKGHASAILSLAVSADGACLVSADQDGAVKVWDVATGRERATLPGHTGPVYGVAVSGDGKCIVTGGDDQTVRVWDGETHQVRHVLAGHTGPVLSVAVSGDGRWVVSGSADLTAKVWDTQTGQEVRTLVAHSQPVSSVAVCAEGQRVVTANGRTAKVWDALSGREEHTLEGHTDLVYGVAVSPDGQCIVTGSFDTRVKVWDAATGHERHTLVGHTAAVYGVAVSPDGQRIVSGGMDKTLRMWDAAGGGEVLTLKGHTDSVSCVGVGGTGRWLVSGSRDGTMKVWDVQRCQAAP